MAFYKENFHVRFLDVDNNNILKPTSLVNYFQEIGGQHSSSVGYGLYDIPKIGFAWVLLGWSIKINKLPKWNDDVQVVTWSKGTNEFFSYRDYEAYDSNHKLIAVATSKWVACDANKGSIIKLAPETVANFDAESKSALEYDFKKMQEPKTFDSSFNYTVLRHDIDTNNHLNNAKYVSLAFETIPQEVYDSNISRIEVMYKSSTILGEKIVCLYSKINEFEYVVTIKNKDLTKVQAIIKIII